MTRLRLLTTWTLGPPGPVLAGAWMVTLRVCMAASSTAGSVMTVLALLQYHGVIDVPALQAVQQI